MRGTGLVTLGAAAVYAYFTSDGPAVRLRLSCGEWDLLGLCEGRRVRLALPGRPPRELLVLSASRTPPVVWLDLAPAARSAG